MASTATSILGKRQHDGSRDIGEPSTSYPRLYYHYVLEPESSCPSEEDTESVHSIQDKTTDSAKDTPDTSSSEEEEEEENSLSEYVPEDVEYEPRSLSDSDIRHPFTVNESFSTSSNDDDIMIKKGKIIKAVTENTSSSSTSSSDDTERLDPELSLTDYWFCVKCRTPNNNPLFRFCEKCFGDRKNFFPPRPKPRTKKRKQRTKRRKAKRSKTTNDGGSNSSNTSQPSLPISSNSTDELTSGQSTLKESLTSSNNSEIENTCGDNSSSKTVVSSRSLACQTESSEQWPSFGETCETCMARPKDGVFIHTKIVHRYSCYGCSKKIWKEIGRCPLCNNKVCNVKKIAG